LVDSFYNIIETCTDNCHICFVFSVLCQEVADAEELAEDVVSAIMILDIAKQLSAAEAVPGDESAAKEAVPGDDISEPSGSYQTPKWGLNGGVLMD
jgi:hypothetical protein